MFWADEFAQTIIDSGKHRPYWVDDMKTPSGRVHIGSVRAVVTHELIYRALKDRGVSVTFSYVLEDHDPMDGLPVYLDQKKFTPHLGRPLFQIPSPDSGYASFGRRWGEEYKEIFNSIGVHPKVIWGSELYLSGRMNGVVKECLDKASVIRDIYIELYGKNAKPKGWIPFSVVCEKCGKLSTTMVTGWDGDRVAYECKINAVDWTKGCGYRGKTSPFSNKVRYAGKLPWKVEWACKWKVIGVTIEGAGKDHMSQGGSHDISKQVSKRVINYPVPFYFSHEFFLTGGRKMSSSRGIGSSAKEVAEIIPPYLIRFMITRVRYNRAINFDPEGNTIPDLFDAYDEVAVSYWRGKDKKLARIFELSQIEGKPPAEHFLPRFRDVAYYLQDPKVNLIDQFEAVKGSELTDWEKQVLNERGRYAKIWLERYASSEKVFQITKKVPKEAADLTSEQRQYLGEVAKLLGKEWSAAEDLQQALYEKAKERGLSGKNAFTAIYTALLGKTYGPKAAWLLIENKEIAVNRFKASVSRKG
ncbi:lysine--tRNA ligase [Microgenomates group bacterium RIFCSPLOWO2_01_FULL_46_13]|nr:MAG: lysine--tRNA ligase [Microgenomates group bacterium RIFCSPHIGHO2_01_FULL_45_11]OGV94925.1 MAG: lysine--tRNA ligase [Microgenomates group bacterium RIFCSPLOWO2_01_FULL_46_13]